MSYFDELEGEPWRFDVLDLMRRIERSLGNPEPKVAGTPSAAALDRRPRIGDSASRKDEIVRIGGRDLRVSFGQDPWMEFPASNVARVARRPDHTPEPAKHAIDDEFERNVPPPDRVHILVRYLGLLGPQGALPLSTTEEAHGWLMERDDAFVHFLDIFNNRFLQLFFRAWADSRPIVQHDRADCDRFGAYVDTVIGAGSRAFQGLGAVPKGISLYAGLLGPQTKSASRLRSAIRGLFGVEVEIDEFVGSWLAFEESELSAIGERNSGLGGDLLVGAASYSVQDKFRVRIFVENMEQYQKFLPIGRHARELVDLVYFYVGDELDWDVELALPARFVRPVELGTGGALGWTTWMSPNYPPDQYRCDARFNPAERLRRERRARAEGRTAT